MSTPTTALARDIARRETRSILSSGKKPHPVDKYVGQRLRGRRLERGLSQEDVGEAIGLTFQQLQKYEKGANRISCSMLARLAEVLEVKPGWFFEGAPGQDGTPGSDGSQLMNDMMASREGVTIAQSFVSIRNPHLRGAIASFVKQVAEERGRR